MNLVALLGTRDRPTDGVADYCSYLAGALENRGVNLSLNQVAWDQIGWRRALWRVWRQAAAWRGGWVLIQYTALAWSRRGFPLALPFVVAFLRVRGARCAVVFHDPSAFGGSRLRDRMRASVQRASMGLASRLAQRSLLTVPAEHVAWRPVRAAFVPVGSSLSVPSEIAPVRGGRRTVAVFGVTGGGHTAREAADIALAVSRAAERLRKKSQSLHLVVLGRGSEAAAPFLHRALTKTGVSLEVLGLLPAEEGARVLAGADAQLFVRGPISSRRSSAIAGITCGLPVVAYEGAETTSPITEAGVRLAPLGDREALAEALAQVLEDGHLREELAELSSKAHEAWFSWEAIAERILEELEGTVSGRPSRVLLVSSHPVQYSAPLYRRYAADTRLDVTVAYCSLQGAEPGVDPEFEVEVAWDLPLLEGYPWVEVPNRSPRPGLGRFFGLINPGLWRLIRNEGFDAVVLYTGYRYASFWIALAAAKRSRTPVLFGTDATGLAPRDRSSWKLSLKRVILPRIFGLADVVIVPSSGTFDFIQSLGINAGRIVLTPFVVDNEWWRRQASEVDRESVRRHWGIPNGAPVVLFCGKLQPWKAPQEVLSAFVRAEVPEAYLVFAGEGPLRQDLESQAHALGVAERVRFLGFVNQSGLPEVYAASDLLVLPSHYEPFGLVVNEAMLHGLPTILSDRVGAGRDLVRHGETGYVFPAGDVEGLARCLREALTDTSLLREMGEVAARRMETWSPKENTERLVEALELAVDSRRDSR